MANATLLVHPKPDAPINVMTDALDIAIGSYATIPKRESGALSPTSPGSYIQQSNATAHLIVSFWQSTVSYATSDIFWKPVSFMS